MKIHMENEPKKGKVETTRNDRREKEKPNKTKRKANLKLVWLWLSWQGKGKQREVEGEKGKGEQRLVTFSTLVLYCLISRKQIV